MEANPYSAPGAVVEDVRPFSANDLESRKATRGKRLGAAMLDGLTTIVWVAPIIWGAARIASVQHGLRPAGTMAVLLLIGIVLAIGVVIVNCIWLSQSGQTIGKRMLDIAIVRTDGSRVGLRRVILLRVLPLMLLGLIPFVGRFVGLIDCLWIFGNERRCLHDLIADTIVVDA